MSTQKIDFLNNLLEYSKIENFSFLSPEQNLENPKRMSGGKQALLAGLAGLAGGIIWASGVGYSEQKKGDLINDMRGMSEYCDLIGIKLDTGACIVRIIIDSDELSGESLVGRCAMIHERCLTFRKYSLVVMRNWIIGDTTSGTYAQVVTVFSSHKRAREFALTYAEKCVHKSRGMVTNRGGLLATYPWVVDLEDEDVAPVGTKWLGMLPQTGMFLNKYKTEFFRKRAV